MTFSATLDKTLRVYRGSFGRLLAISAVTGVVQMPLMLALEMQPDSNALRGGYWVNMALIFVLTGIISTIEYAAFGRVLIGLYQGQPVGFREAFRATFSRLPTLLACGSIMFLATGLGLMLLLIPGIYIFFGFSLGFMVVMAEEASAVRALKRSWALIDNRRGRVFALVFVWGLLSAIISYAIGGVMELVSIPKTDVTKAVANQLAALVVSPCYGLSLGLVYYDMREEKEGHDLALAAQQLAGREPASEPGHFCNSLPAGAPAV
jgi:hypothetical protein